MGERIGRLAPSPTGAQHLGNARTFLVAWLSIRQNGGKLILRIEDLDTPRTKRGAAEQAIEDLRWLGLDWDAEPGGENGFPPLVQSRRLSRYQEIFEHLKAKELVYPCTCSRSDVEIAQSAPHESQPIAQIGSSIDDVASVHGTERRYPGNCSYRGVADEQSLIAAGVNYCWRFRMPDRTMEWVDGFCGFQSMNPREQLGDFVIGRANGAPAYQLAVVVDDFDMGITEVVRGDDLVPSTYRQLAIYEALEWTPPQMNHLPLVIGPDGRRLAKRHGDTRLASLRQRGIAAETILGYFALKHGWIPKYAPLEARQMIEIANIASIPKSPLCFSAPDAFHFFGTLQSNT